MLDTTQYSELLQKLHANRFWFLILGVLLSLGGLFALSYSMMATVVVIYFIAGFLLATGILQLLHSFYIKESAIAFVVSVLWSVAYLVAGCILFVSPDMSAASLTMALAILLIAFGASRFIYAFKLKGLAGAGWLYLTGAFNILFGVLILAYWPLSITILGIMLGVDLLMQGISLIMLFITMGKKAD